MRAGGRVVTIDSVGSNFYGVEEHCFCLTDEMLEPAGKTLDNLCAGDFIRGDSGTRKILARVDSCYLLSADETYTTAWDWYTAYDLKKCGYSPFEPDTPESTIEINGKEYKKAEVEEAIEDLEPIE